MLSLLAVRFPSPTLEARYRDFLASEHYLREDVRFGAVRILTIIALAVRSLSLNGMGPPTLGVAVVLLGPLGQVTIQRWASEAQGHPTRLRAYVRARTGMFVFWRLVLVPLAAKYWFSGWFPGPARGASVWALGAFYAMGSGIAILAIVSLAGNLVLEEHLAVQVAAVGLMVRMRGPDFCIAVTGNDAMRSHVVWAWRALEATSRTILEAVYFAAGQPVAPAGTPDPESACQAVLAAAYIAVGLVGITYVLWLREMRSREEFLAGEVWGEGHEWLEGFWWRRLTAWRLAAHGMLAGVFCAVAWRVVSGLLPGPCEGEAGVSEGGSGDVGVVVVEAQEGACEVEAPRSWKPGDITLEGGAEL